MNDDYNDLFVSYAREDDANGWITEFLRNLKASYHQKTHDKPFKYFLDVEEIGGFDDWQHRLRNEIAKSRLFLAFVSPAYFASEWCLREWRAWIDTEIATHILSSGAAPIYIVDVPGLIGRSQTAEHDVADWVADRCTLTVSRDVFVASASSVIKQIRRRQFNRFEPFFQQGNDAFCGRDFRKFLDKLALDLDARSQRVRLGANSPNTVPPYNRNFSGRIEELHSLREFLTDDQAGVICGVHGLGGMGKTELAFAFAHAFASAYPGGRFLIPCDGQSDLCNAILHLGAEFRDQISDEERKQPESYFAAIAACLKLRLEDAGHVLLVLDNVTDAQLLTQQQTDHVTSLGGRLHLLATTRLPPTSHRRWLSLDALSESDSVTLLEKHRSFATDDERTAGHRIARRLGGYALAVELVAGWLAIHKSVSYTSFLERLGLAELETLDELAGDDDFELRRHNDERRLDSVLKPTLESLNDLERLALEFAAFLPPDDVPLPWLYDLLDNELELEHKAGYEDPRTNAVSKLTNLALLSREESPDAGCNLVRIHRLVQAHITRELAPETTDARLGLLRDYVTVRVNASVDPSAPIPLYTSELRPLGEFILTHRLSTSRDSVIFLCFLSGHWQEVGEWNQAWRISSSAVQIAEQDCERGSKTVIDALNQFGLLCRNMTRNAEALQVLQRALSLLDDHPSDEVNATPTLHNLGLVLADMGQWDEAEEMIQRAIQTKRDASIPEDTEYAGLYNTLGFIQRTTGRFDSAEKSIREALRINESCLGPDHRDVAHTLRNLANALSNQDKIRDALKLVHRAEEIDARLSDVPTKDLVDDWQLLGAMYVYADKPNESEKYTRKALEYDEAIYGPTHPRVASKLTNLAHVLPETKDGKQEAERLLLRAIDIYSQNEFDPGLLTTINNLAGLLQADDRKDEAEAMYRQALEMTQAVYGEQSHQASFATCNLGLVLHEMARHDEAEQALRDSLAIARLTYPEKHLEIGRVSHNLGLVLIEQENVTEAIKLFEESLRVQVAFLQENGTPHRQFNQATSMLANVMRQAGYDREAIQSRLARNGVEVKLPPEFSEPKEAIPPAPIAGQKRPGRNDPCPCGSGKKFKKCCMRLEL